MPPRIVHISEADGTAAKYEFLNHPEPSVQKRMLCLRLKYRGYENHTIADILELSRNTIGNYLTLYEESGFEGLKTLNYKGPKSKLDKHQPKVEASFRQNPPRSVKEARARIKSLTGIKRSPTRIRAFLNRMGMKPLATGQIPAKADPVKQKQFHDQVLQPLLKKAQKGKCHVLFMDSAHFVLAAFVAIVWCFERVFIKTAPGRFRLNVIAAIHATSQKLTALYNTTYITADTVVQLLEEIARQYAGLPVYIILDNARYQHCQLVKDTALKLKLNLVFLPPYSPNLNLIERLWKFVKAEVCAANYFQDAKTFQNSIIDFLYQLNRKKSMKKQLKTRLSLNFQLFSNAQNLTA
jgi:transposase